MPELTEISKHIMFEETSQGLNLEIVDQDGRSMFADGSKLPYERTRRLIQKLAAPLKATPPRISIIGHTAAGFVPAQSGYGAFDLSADRATPCGRFSRGKDCHRPTFLRFPEKLTASHSFPTIPRYRRTVA
jgi:flagellar motor protein MotB